MIEINEHTYSSEDKEIFQQGLHLQQAQQFSAAIILFQQLLAKNPRHQPTLHALGVLYAQQGETTRAINYLQQTLVLQPDDANLHNHLGNAFRKNNQLEHAINHYQQALILEPNYAQAHNNIAAIYALKNDYQQALHHYRLAVHARPDFIAAHYNLGLLLLRHNQLKAARTQFNNVIILEPGYWEAHFYLGVLYLQENALVQAKQALQTVVHLQPNHLQALTNLGVIALKNQQGQIAVDFFSRALALDNSHLEARNNLASTFMHYDRFENALMHYDVLLQGSPDNIEYLYNSGVAQMALGHLNEAKEHFNHLLSLDSKHFATLNNLAAIYIRLNDKEQAKYLLQKAVAINPQDTSSQHMLNALENNNVHVTNSPEYASNLFNNYALNYEEHMQKQLAYSLPQHIDMLCQQLAINSLKASLDLGCGTGLIGTILRPFTQQLTGVDIASKMIAQAQQKNIYDELITAELEQFLATHKKDYDLIICADVLPYFAELEKLFHEISNHLQPAGYFIFTTEISETKAWQLQSSARFSHHLDYLKNLCQNFSLEIVNQQQVVARQQEQQDLWVHLIIARKSN